MRRVKAWACATLLLIWALQLLAQQSATAASGVVPPLMKFSGVLSDVNGKPLTGVVGVTFYLYKDQEGGVALWMETQNVQAGAEGHYSVQLGATKSDGLPTDAFASGEARWLGVQIAGQEEQPRVLLLSVPYALKAADAATIGGLPPSAFVRANAEDGVSSAGSAASNGTTATDKTIVGGNSKNQPPILQTVKTNGGTTNVLPIWTGTTTIGNSAISQSGGNVIVKSGSKVGIGTGSPGFLLTVGSSTNSSKAIFESSDNNHGTIQIGNPTSNGEASMEFISGVSAFGDNPTSTNGNNHKWGVGAGIFGIGGSAFGIGNDALGGPVMTLQSTGSVGIGTTNPNDGLDVFWNSSFGGAILAKIETANSDAGAVTGITKGNIVGAAGVIGSATDTGGGVTYGVFGSNAATDQFAAAVYGRSIATSGPTRGTVGEADSPNGTGVWGWAVSPSKTGSGIGCCPVGIWGDTGSNAGGAAGLVGTADDGRAIYLENNSPSGVPTAFIKQDASGKPALVTVGDTNITGNLTVTGNVSKGSGSFKIDHPLDPANKYLYHSFVESPDMMDIYNGNVTTNKQGVAVVVMPDYFEALNHDFRYQLTPIGRFAEAIVAKEISHGHFTIKTSRPGVKVSWQVTGIRHDAYADAHRIQVEEEKPLEERGKYLHPELFGAPPEKAVGYSAPPQSTPALPMPVPATMATLSRGN
jgi:hypothetical protein